MTRPDGAAARAGAAITAITGGVTGLEATFAAVRALADGFDAAGDRMREWAGLGARVMADGDLVESALLSPVTFAAAEAAVLAATSGPDGVLVESVGWEADALLVRVAVTALEEADRLVGVAVESLERRVGRAAGLALGVAALHLLPTAVVVGGLTLAAWPHLPAPARRRLFEEAAAAGREAERWVTAHPAAVETMAGGGGGLLEGLWEAATPLSPGGPLGIPLLAPDTEAAAALLAAAYGEDGSARVTRLPDVTVPAGTTQPGGVADLVAHLQQVALLSPEAGSPLNGTIEVQTLTGPAGAVRHIVYLPGTDDMATLPWTRDHDVRDMGTNLRLVAGQPNAYQQGILEAMARAGIGPDDPVLLVGHSQGGMEAAAILSQGGGFDVTNVVTAGSPTAQVDGFPAGSHVLSLEHQGDVVPLLDGAPNPDSTEQLTVRFDDGGAGVADHHGYPHYVAGAAAVDASTDPAVVEQVDSLRGHGFLPEAVGGSRPVEVRSQVFQVTRHR